MFNYRSISNISIIYKLFLKSFHQNGRDFSRFFLQVTDVTLFLIDQSVIIYQLSKK